MNQSTFRWRMAAFAGAVALAGVCLAASAVALVGDAPPNSSRASRGVQLDPANRPQVYDKLPPDKQAVLDRENELRNQALGHPYSERTPGVRDTLDRVTPTSRLSSEVHPLNGGFLVDIGCDQMYPSADFTGTNRWSAPEDDHSVVACGGALRSDASQGLVLVSLWDQKGNQRLADGRGGKFPTERRDGAVTIVDASGSVLTLRTKDGPLLYFDLVSLKYVDGPVPEKATPTPGATAP